jgi:hypothetical protein
MSLAHPPAMLKIAGEPMGRRLARWTVLAAAVLAFGVVRPSLAAASSGDHEPEYRRHGCQPNEVQSVPRTSGSAWLPSARVARTVP